MCTKEWQFSPTTKSVLCKVVNSKCVPSVSGLRNVPSTQTQRSMVQGQTLSTYLCKFDTNYSHSVYPLTFNSWLNSHDLNDRTGRVARIGDTKGEYRILVRETWGEKCHLENTWVHEGIILKCIFKKYVRTAWIDLAQDGDRWRALVRNWFLENSFSGENSYLETLIPNIETAKRITGYSWAPESHASFPQNVKQSLTTRKLTTVARATCEKEQPCTEERHRTGAPSILPFTVRDQQDVPKRR
jgi:hypothetical protein